MNLTYTDVEKLISKFSYKPNFEFTIRRSGTYIMGRDNEHISIGVTMWTLDSTGTYPPARQFIGLYPSAMAGIGGAYEAYAENGRQSVHLEPTKVGSTTLVPLMALRSENEFWHWLRRVIADVEHHEIDEWFKVDGVAVNDPHKKELQ